MAYSNHQAERIRHRLNGIHFTEKKMMGGLIFMVRNAMCVGYSSRPCLISSYLRIMINWNTPTPPTAPFIASIFNYYLSDHLEGYAEYDEKTLALVKTIPGYLGYESMKHEGRGTFISYWKDMESVQVWAAHPIHIEAKKLGLTWYKYYHSMIAEVGRFHSHSFNS